jgi:hypothetical protein
MNSFSHSPSSALRPATLLALAALVPAATFAQPAAIDNRLAPDPLAGQLSPADDEALLEDGGDPDQLTRAERAARLRLALDNELTYQSNAELDGRGGQGDLVWFPSIAATADYKVSDTLSLEARAALQTGVYADLTELDFWGATGELLGRRALGAGGWSLYGGVEAYDYQSLDDGDSLSRAIAPKAGLGYLRYYAESRTYGFADLGVKHRYTDPASDERDEFTASLGVTRQLADRVYAQGFYEYRFANYEDGGREDQRHYLSASVTYLFTDAVRAGLSLSFLDNDSNTAGADYQTVNTGLSSSVSWEF